VARSRDDKETPTLAQVLDTFATFMNNYSRFSETEREIVTAFNLDPLREAEFWYDMLSAKEVKTRQQAVDARWSTLMMEQYIPKVLHLLQRPLESVPIIVRDSGKKEKSKSKLLPTETVTFFIRESETPNLSVDQFAHILNAVQNLYNVILKVHNLGHSELVVGALDSGSDKSIDIIGVAAAIAKLSELLLQSWDRVRFGRTAKMSASIKTASDGLTLLTQVASAVSAGTITNAEGEKLRRTVVKSIGAPLKIAAFRRTMRISCMTS
jgi:hypothetical protein